MRPRMAGPPASGANVGGAALPPEAIDIIRHVVRRARLTRNEAREVAEELTAHFLDGLESGASLAELLEGFGSPELTASLIHEAKVQGRPLLWRVAVRTGLAAAAVMLVLGAIYLSSAAALHLSRPSYATDLEAAVAQDHAAAAEHLRVLWSLEDPAVQTIVAQAGIADGFRSRYPTGANVDADARVRELLATARRLRAERSVAGDLAAAHVELEALTEMERGLDRGTLSGAGIAIARRYLETPVELTGVRAAFAVVVDQLYSENGNGDGHLTMDGIEQVRKLKGWHEPSLKDRLMEPVWYRRPAGRHEVLDRFEGLLGLVEGHTFRGRTVDEAVQPLTQVEECIRYPSLSAVLKPLYEVLSATESVQAARANVGARLGAVPTS